MRTNWKLWAKAALIRAVRTFAEAALASMLRLRCTELCCMIHTAPAELPGSLTAGAANMMSLSASAACARTVDEKNGEVVLSFDAYHSVPLKETVELVFGSPSYSAGNALKQARSYWGMALDRIVNAAYKAADPEARKTIAKWRQGLDTMIEARADLLSLIYEDEEKVTNEAILNLYRDALIDACSNK